MSSTIAELEEEQRKNLKTIKDLTQRLQQANKTIEAVRSAEPVKEIPQASAQVRLCASFILVLIFPACR